MHFFKPLGIFFILKGIFGDEYSRAMLWLNSLKALQNFNNENSSIFVADEMITMGKSLDFLREERFVKLANQIFIGEGEDEPEHRALIWRRHTLVWAGEHCKNLKGSFCEFGCYDGAASQFINEYCELESKKIDFYLYDTFVAPPNSEKFPKHSKNLFKEVKERFSENKNIKIIKGILPNSLEQTCPNEISFAHLDLNSVDAELGVLRFIFDRIVSGGMIILDDYGWIAYKSQLKVEKDFFEKKDLKVLELPTGQGLVVKR